MAEIGVKELKSTASAVIDRVEGGAAYVVTRRGRPAAVLLPVEEAEDLVLANADEYIRFGGKGVPRTARVARSNWRTWADPDIRVEVAPAAAMTLRKMPPDVRGRITEALLALAGQTGKPKRIAGKSVKTIQGVGDSFHRLRVGDYRVMYDAIDEDRVILVLGVVHRGDLERWLRNR